MSQREWAPIIAALNAGDALDYDQSYWLMDQVMSGELGDARLASFLTAMAIKGATGPGLPRLAGGQAAPAPPRGRRPPAPGRRRCRRCRSGRRCPTPGSVLSGRRGR